MSDLRTAALRALEAMKKATRFMSDSDYKKLNEAIEDLDAVLAIIQPEIKDRVEATSLKDRGLGDPSLTCSSPGLRVQTIAPAVTNTPWSAPAAAPVRASQTWYLMTLLKSK